MNEKIANYINNRIEYYEEAKKTSSPLKQKICAIIDELEQVAQFVDGV